MLTNVLVIFGIKHVFICDTYLGHDVMDRVHDEIYQNYSKEPWTALEGHARAEQRNLAAIFSQSHLDS